MTAPIYIAWLALAAVAFQAMLSAVQFVCDRAGHVRPNVDGNRIPTSLGLAFVPFIWLLGAASYFVEPAGGSVILPLILLTAGFGLLGLIDDLIPARQAGGFRGHLKAFAKTGKPSTALLKAFFGGLLALCVAYLLHGRRWGPVAMDGALIALSANFFNLLDVHPGRCIKGFLAASGAVFGISLIGAAAGGWGSLCPESGAAFGPLLIAAAVFARVDFARRGMLGDAGSNVLGAALGLLLALELSVSSRAVALAALAALTILSEVVSFSAIIRSFPPLRWLDDLFIAAPLAGKKD